MCASGRTPQRKFGFGKTVPQRDSPPGGERSTHTPQTRLRLGLRLFRESNLLEKAGGKDQNEHKMAPGPEGEQGGKTTNEPKMRTGLRGTEEEGAE